jgi:hypothetical protein
MAASARSAFGSAEFQCFTSSVGQPHDICPRILPVATPLQEILVPPRCGEWVTRTGKRGLLSLPHKLSNGRTINSRLFNDIGLTQSVAFANTGQHRELAWRQRMHFATEDLVGGLPCSMQEMNRKTLERTPIPAALRHFPSFPPHPPAAIYTSHQAVIIDTGNDHWQAVKYR